MSKIEFFCRRVWNFLSVNFKIILAILCMIAFIVFYNCSMIWAVGSSDPGFYCYRLISSSVNDSGSLYTVTSQTPLDSLSSVYSGNYISPATVASSTTHTSSGTQPSTYSERTAWQLALGVSSNQSAKVNFPENIEPLTYQHCSVRVVQISPNHPSEQWSSPLIPTSCGVVIRSPGQDDLAISGRNLKVSRLSSSYGYAVFEFSFDYTYKGSTDGFISALLLSFDSYSSGNNGLWSCYFGISGYTSAKTGDYTSSEGQETQDEISDDLKSILNKFDKTYDQSTLTPGNMPEYEQTEADILGSQSDGLSSANSILSGISNGILRIAPGLQWCQALFNHLFASDWITIILSIVAFLSVCAVLLGLVQNLVKKE